MKPHEPKQRFLSWRQSFLLGFVRGALTLLYRHGPGLDAGAEWPSPLIGAGPYFDVVSGIRLQVSQSDTRVLGDVNQVLLAIYVPVYHCVVDDLAVPFCQDWRVPSNFCGGSGETHHTQVLWEATWHIFSSCDLLLKLLSWASSVLGRQFEEVRGPLVQVSHCVVMVSLPEVYCVHFFLIQTSVLQPVTQQLPYHLLGWVPLDEGCVHGCRANHHGGLPRDCNINTQ